MKRIVPLTRIGVVLLSLFTFSAAFGAGESRVRISGSSQSNDSPTGWVPFAAIGVNSVGFDKALDNRDGFSTNGRAIGSYYTLSENYVFDIGAGADFADLNGQEVNTALVELAARGRLGSSKKWQLGPVVNFNVGPGAGTDYGSSVDSIATFAGLQIARDFAVGESSIIRAGLKGMTDIGIPNSVATKALFELQYGQVAQTKITERHTVEAAPVEELPQVFEAEEAVIVEEASTTRPVEVVEKTELVEEQKYYRNPVEVVEMTAVQPLYFSEGENRIGPRNKAMVQRYVRFFNRNKHKIKLVQMIGYVDDANESSRSTGLSFERAQRIKSELKAYGLDENIVTEALGAGVLSPHQVGQDPRRARRVDIQVLGLENSDWENELRSLHR